LPVPVLFFPEGTSTDGSSLVRFHSRLFEPAAVAGAPVTAAAIRYVIEDGTPERALCWFGDESFLPHLWKTLGTAGFSGEVQFGEPRVYSDRRIAAGETHAEIEAMRSGGVPALR
jgi:1-acyl-sn-glycerol-3-phosphate acyltransferase